MSAVWQNFYQTIRTPSRVETGNPLSLRNLQFHGWCRRIFETALETSWYLGKRPKANSSDVCVRNLRAFPATIFSVKSARSAEMLTTEREHGEIRAFPERQQSIRACFSPVAFMGGLFVRPSVVIFLLGRTVADICSSFCSCAFRNFYKATKKGRGKRRILLVDCRGENPD